MSGGLFSTDHVTVGYGLEFDGVLIERLSLGTRGIVLLLLYLAIDSQDDQPLIVDQPEENLDPQSIYDELVVEFQRAKLRRQVIIVTHNANLVVETDADQVIVTRCGNHEPGHLPRMSYVSGGLEEPAIREADCAILEGGKRAFQERASDRVSRSDRGLRCARIASDHELLSRTAVVRVVRLLQKPNPATYDCDG